eukprot:198372-Amphidinium_carterae.1
MKKNGKRPFLKKIPLGAFFFPSTDACASQVEDCDRNSCEETGGYTKSYLDAWCPASACLDLLLDYPCAQ